MQTRTLLPLQGVMSLVSPTPTRRFVLRRAVCRLPLQDEGKLLFCYFDTLGLKVSKESRSCLTVLDSLFLSTSDTLFWNSIRPGNDPETTQKWPAKARTRHSWTNQRESLYTKERIGKVLRHTWKQRKASVGFTPRKRDNKTRRSE